MPKFYKFLLLCFVLILFCSFPVKPSYASSDVLTLKSKIERILKTIGIQYLFKPAPPLCKSIPPSIK